MEASIPKKLYPKIGDTIGANRVGGACVDISRCNGRTYFMIEWEGIECNLIIDVEYYIRRKEFRLKLADPFC